MTRTFFITGTDTNVGKTYVSLGLLKKFKALDLKVIAIKPIGTGGFIKGNKIYNEDALLLQKNSSISLHYDCINSFSFLSAVAPNIAAKLAKQSVTVDRIYQKVCATTINKHSDVCIIEGTGGWQTPLNEHETMADLVVMLDISVILVISIKLGCLNHSILTYQSILSKNLEIKAWVANCIDSDVQELEAIIETLNCYIKSPCLGIIRFQQKPEEALNINLLL